MNSIRYPKGKFVNYGTERLVSIPESVLDSLLAAEAASSAHYNLCETVPIADQSAPSHPGDPLGRTVAWLWSINERDRCTHLVADYFAEMRMYNPCRQAEGNRLIWNDLKYGIGSAASIALDSEQIDELLSYLDDQVPRFYGEAPKRLNTP